MFKRVLKVIYLELSFRFPQLLVLQKIRILKSRNVNIWSLISFKYILVGTELDTFSYNLRNINELAHLLSEYFSTEKNLQMDILNELVDSAAQSKNYFSGLHEKKIGRYLFSYGMIRNIKPDLVIELGTKHGLGSICILQAIQRNNSGKLVSADVDMKSSNLTKNKQFANYDHSYIESVELLKNLKSKSETIFVISDSLCDDSYIKSEFKLCTTLARNRIYFQYNLGWSTLFDGENVRVLEFTEVSDHFFYPGRTSRIYEVSLA